ncbi:hypothetical protein PR202_ga08502 [Eleusine coracana subsp. coracana]|uniref:non-specific serine/threonine protein kinase n=1 Tax=Eleusine coracana subsp. coracana TaxID=191504 RepID=A0AAV5C1X8_ELECO|nr:hypothetical protein PR202_ga08502 [Eleusine coracana subsp. coracana]
MNSQRAVVWRVPSFGSGGRWARAGDDEQATEQGQDEIRFHPNCAAWHCLLSRDRGFTEGREGGEGPPPHSAEFYGLRCAMPRRTRQGGTSQSENLVPSRFPVLLFPLRKSVCAAPARNGGPTPLYQEPAAFPPLKKTTLPLPCRRIGIPDPALRRSCTKWQAPSYRLVGVHAQPSFFRPLLQQQESERLRSPGRNGSRWSRAPAEHGVTGRANRGALTILPVPDPEDARKGTPVAAPRGGACCFARYLSLRRTAPLRNVYQGDYHFLGGEIESWLQSGCGFSGELPDAWGNLQHLEYLDLSNNQLTGALPVSLYGLKMLKEMFLDGNSFSGQLSPAIGQLQELRKLSIPVNAISGALPLELGALQNLEFLDIHANALSGLIPATFSNLSKLLHLDASQNNLSGSIFPGITSMANLLTIDLSSNSLTGPLPKQIGQLQHLKLLGLGHNDFSGSIPEEIGDLKLLELLGLPACKLSGRIPWTIGSLKSLKELDISENNFQTELPTSIGKLGNLTSLFASNAGLIGNIPRELGNCKKLKTVYLSFNSFAGTIPEELANLEAIDTFLVEGNNLSGHVPDWIRNWVDLHDISLAQNMFHGPLPSLSLQHLVSFSAGSNMLSGSIPAELCQSNSLKSLVLHNNNLTGDIMEAFKECKNLTELDLLGNHLHGEIPDYLDELPLVKLDLPTLLKIVKKLWKSSTLLEICLSYNQLTGSIPESIGGLSSLQRLQIDGSYLEGPIPRSLGGLKNLTNLSLRGNRLSGDIPLELFNCRNLVTLDLSSNNLTGHIPSAISQLSFLNSLDLSYNVLSGAIPAEICVGFENEAHPDSEFFQHHGFLDLSYNRLTGHIPTTIKDCAMVTVLNLQGNFLSGTIPPELGALANLTTINLAFNALVGPMLPWPAPLLQLQGLFLSNNRLDGSIPSNISQILPKIAVLDLSSNVLTGTLPKSLLCKDYLTRLDVSNNSLSGQIPFLCPKEKQSSSSLLFFNASSNHFSGNLDGSISNFTQLSSLDIHNNSLNGSLPSELSDLSSLNYLDLSSNGFHGAIPCGICNMYSLTFVNFSGNDIGMESLANCVAAGICPGNGIDHMVVHSSRRVLRAAIICVILAVIIAVIVLVVYLRWKLLRSKPEAIIPISKSKASVEPTSSDELLGRKSREPLSINVATFEHALLRVTADDILKATENFSKVHIIGDGGFGTVYRAALPEGRRVAIKRLHGGHQFQGDREFLAEMETIGKVKHPNLVPLLGYCVCGDERFLIYEYMENGSLEMWLNNRADAVEALGWPDRLKICLGSAHGLAFLHHGFVPHIIHRDMKSSNILLDENFEPRVSDFGLARIISACETHVSTDIAGTFGYIPPEYGQAMKSSTKGDVYSFGVVMLELLTGRPPTGQEEVEGGGNLVGWVRWMIAHGKKNELFDPCLPVSSPWREQMLCVLSIAQNCTVDEPWKRPTMMEVVKGLKMAQAMERGPLVVKVSTL